MGMFDEIYLNKEVKCPCGHKQSYFQTKDICNCLYVFRVNKDNTLEFQKNEFGETSKKERGKFGFPILKVIKSEWIPYPATMAINVYTTCDKCQKYEFYGYMLVEDGKVKNLKIKTSSLK